MGLNLNEVFMITTNEFVQMATPTGPMQAQVFRPLAQGAFPCIIFYSEIGGIA